jgi:hypothetical protein
MGCIDVICIESELYVYVCVRVIGWGALCV